MFLFIVYDDGICVKLATAANAPRPFRQAGQLRYNYRQTQHFENSPLTLTLRYRVYFGQEDENMASYTVRQLAGMAGVSVRTLHYYDQIGLLRPSARTAAGYRLYGRDDLLRLQQILFFNSNHP